MTESCVLCGLPTGVSCGPCLPHIYNSEHAEQQKKPPLNMLFAIWMMPRSPENLYMTLNLCVWGPVNSLSIVKILLVVILWNSDLAVLKAGGGGARSIKKNWVFLMDSQGRRPISWVFSAPPAAFAFTEHSSECPSHLKPVWSSGWLIFSNRSQGLTELESPLLTF